MVQATEVVKYLLGSGELLADRLFVWDGMQTHAEEITVERNPVCPSCSTKNTPERMKK